MSLESTLEQDAAEAREKELFEKPLRIAPLNDGEYSDDAAAIIAEVRKVMGITEENDIPVYFKIGLKHPELFKAQMEIGMKIVGPNAALPRREAELAILRIGWLLRAPFEWGEHVAIGKRFGLTDEEVERVTIGSSAPGWNEHDRAIVKGVEELLDDTYISDATWEALAKSWNDAQLLEFPVLVGLYVTTAMHQNAMRLRLHPGNVGLKRR
jgi:alkylhydroperoxidase family enzyme